MLNVTKEDLSDWELDKGYPDVETILKISDVFNVPLDILMNGEVKSKKASSQNGQDTITISSPHEGITVSCNKLSSSKLMNSKPGEPQYALVGIRDTPGWGSKSTVLGWYRNRADIMAEIGEISKAMLTGEISYELKYSVETVHGIFRIKIVG